MRHDGKYRPCSSADRISHAEDQPSDAREHESACTHGTGFFGDVKICPVQPPVTDRSCGLRDGQYFGMCRGVAQGFHLIMGTSNDAATPNDHCAARHLAFFRCRLGLLQGHLHEAHERGGVRQFGCILLIVLHRPVTVPNNERVFQSVPAPGTFGPYGLPNPARPGREQRQAGPAEPGTPWASERTGKLERWKNPKRNHGVRSPGAQVATPAI